jgi:hypothetical protein
MRCEDAESAEDPHESQAGMKHTKALFMDVALVLGGCDAMYSDLVY